MYTVIGSIKSRTARVLWMLEELGQPYTHVDAGPRSERVTALNPSGKVPVLLEDEEALTDSTAILTYLADKHGALTAPAGTIARARQDAMTHFLLDEMDAILWTAAKHSFVLPEEHRVPAIKDSLRVEFTQSCNRLAERMKGQFLMGDNMTVPDILATHCLGWAAGARFPIGNPELVEYRDRLRARPAFQRAMAQGGS